jgi:Sulfotransferase family
VLPFSSNQPYPSDAWHQTRRILFRTFRAKKFSDLQKKRAVFDQHRCIFVHSPKCAGLSVVKSLFGDFDCGHTSLKRYQIMFAPAEFRSYFKFTFVRNPFDRLVSAYLFMQKGGINEKDKRWAQRKLSGYKDFSAFVKNWVTPFNVERALHFRPQTKFICLGRRPPALDFVGYLENIKEDFGFVAKKLGIPAQLIETNRNAGREKDYRPYYTNETREIVARVYAEDLRLLGYTFDNADLKSRLTRRGSDGRIVA